MDKMETKDHEDPTVTKELKEKKEKKDQLDHQDHQENQAVTKPPLWLFMDHQDLKDQ